MGNGAAEAAPRSQTAGAQGCAAAGGPGGTRGAAGSSEGRGRCGWIVPFASRVQTGQLGNKSNTSVYWMVNGARSAPNLNLLG